MNIKFLFSFPLGVSCDSRKFDPGTVLAGVGLGLNAVSQGANVINANMSSHQSRELARWQTNQNLALAREQMAANRKAFEDSITEQRYIDERNRAWQLQDTASQREWESAAAVAQRYREAGINPYLAMISGAAGQMAGTGVSPNMSQGHAPTGSIASPSSNPAVSPSYAPLVDFGRGINDAISNFFQARASEQGIIRSDYDIAADKIRLRMDEALARANITKLEKEGFLHSAEADRVRYDLDFMKKVEGDRIRNFSLSNEQIASQIALNQSQDDVNKSVIALNDSSIKLNEIQANRIRTLLTSEIQLAASQVASNYARATFDNTSAADIQNTFDARLRGLKSDVKAKLASAVNLNGQNDRAQKDFDNWFKRFVEPTLGTAISAAGLVLGMRLGGKAMKHGSETSVVEKPYKVMDSKTGDVHTYKQTITTTRPLK